MKKLSFIQLLSIWVFLFAGLINTSKAQSDTTKPFSRKNEIGLNIGPIILVSLGGTPNPQPIGLTYKRVINKWAFRTNFTLIPYKSSWFGFSNDQVQSNDTLYNVRSTSRKTLSYIGRIGIEYRYKFKRGWYFVGGIDLQAQYTDGTRQINEASYRIDSIGSKGTAEQFNHMTLLSHKNLLEEKTITTQIGLGLSVGVMLPLGKRWWVVTQFRADGFFGPANSTTNDYVAGTKKTNSSTAFDFNSGPALSELSLFYRF